MMGLVPSSLRLDGYMPTPSPVATYVRLEYGDADASWFLATGSSQADDQSDGSTTHGPRRPRIHGIVAYLTSMFREARASKKDLARRAEPCTEGPDGPTLAR